MKYYYYRISKIILRLQSIILSVYGFICFISIGEGFHVYNRGAIKFLSFFSMPFLILSALIGIYLSNPLKQWGDNEPRAFYFKSFLVLIVLWLTILGFIV